MEEKTGIATIAASPLAEAKPRIAPMTVSQASRALERGEAILLDLREPGERAVQGVIPGALAAPWGTLAFWDALTDAYHRTNSSATGRVVLCCATGERSAMAADILQRMGYANVTYLRGDFSAWKGVGWPVEDAAVEALAQTGD